MIQSVILAVAAQANPYVVQPYYLVPSDFKSHSQHKVAIERTMDEMRGWFYSRVGAQFTLKPLIEVKSKVDYVTMRVGPNATAEDQANKTFMPNWFASVREAMGGSFRPKQVSVIFTPGGGGYSAGTISGDDAGVAIVGDWILEAQSGFKDPMAIPMPSSTKSTVPSGVLAARMGQAFGLLMPEGVSGMSLVGGFQAYPNTKLMHHEALILRNSPFFGFGSGDQNVPRVDWSTADRGVWGDTFYVVANGLRESDMVEVSWMGKPTSNEDSTVKQISVFVALDGVDESRGRFKVPQGAGNGFIRVWRGSQRSNMVTVNFVASVR
ncbi:MAG: hypothetical protein IT206_09495 [Fimbriimonadaceae bacterium]|nr:hypothetical protein [Fimbriimonadaceae bacterium]